MLSPDGTLAASPCLLRTGVSQAGYGVVIPRNKIPKNHGASADDGLYITNTQTGKRTLLVSIQEIVESATPAFEKAKYRNGNFYGFHVKWNPQGTRLMFVLRWLQKNRFRSRFKNTITMDSDGRNIRVAISDSQWRKKGHHPNWCPDGDHILMNLNLHGNGMRFVTTRYDGSDLRVLHDAVIGSGHPTLHPDGRHILTDAYGHEPIAFGDGTVPIRWIDIQSGMEEQLVRINTTPGFKGPKNQLRVDPHPAWDRGFKRIAFNACPNGKRQVFVAEVIQS
jgi:Tol biopolymer transport system component